ncbi:MAG TPA: glycosyl hydrolase [Candidatus Saccharimonadales bacterium]|nr:glycosyl hydrolase [Candidatus Saccharimonadales bacterium]
MTVRFGGYFHPFPIWTNHKRLEQAEQALRRPIDIVLWYQWWDAGLLTGGKRATRFQTNWAIEAGARDVLIKWEPWKPGKRIVQPEFSLATITAGQHDSYISSWARAIKNYERTIYLCPLPEMNGFWNQWSVPIGKHTPEDFIAAWRHIHDIFSGEAATNVRWVWAPNAGDMPPEYPMELFYPGKKYVDVLGLSVYNWGSVQPWSKWRSFADIVQPYYERLAKLGNQPIWITEMGCAPVGGDKAAWIRDALQHISKLPRLEAAIWFDMKKETDWRITNPDIAPVFWPKA